MARTPAPNDFDINVDGLGRFRIARRTMRDHLKIEAEFSRIIDGTEPTDFLRLIAEWISVLKVVVVEAPDGWDIDNMDPLDSVTYANLKRVYNAVSDKEVEFRGGQNKEKSAAGQETSANAGVLVSQEVQPNA